MTKTSTSTPIANLPMAQHLEKSADEVDQHLKAKLFYHSIRPQLDELIRNPTDETINKILAYSKKK